MPTETENNTMLNTMNYNISMTRQILQNKSEYIAWKRDLMYDLKNAGYIANTKTTSLKSGKDVLVFAIYPAKGCLGIRYIPCIF